MYDTTIVICSKNIQKANFENVNALKKFLIIIVDKDSNPLVLKQLRKYKHVKIYKQRKNGLANARNIGLKYVKTKFVLMLGSDNIIKDVRDIKKAIDYMKKKKWVGVGFLTRIYKKQNYFDNCMDYWWKNKIREGSKIVVGTPCLYLTEIIKSIKYDERVTHADDSLVGEKLKEKNLKQGYSNVIAYDTTENNFESIKERWNRYSISDKEYHRYYCFSFKQKVKSLLHPFRTEWMGFKLWFLPFYVIITSIRFFGRFFND